jgi:hypothetical protein
MEKDILEDYISQNLSLNKISKLTGKSLTSIIYWKNKYGLKSNCKNFKGSGKTEYIDFRFCPHCKQDVKLEDFYKRRGDNYSAYCKKCTSDYRMSNYVKNKIPKEKKKRQHSEETKLMMSKAKIEFFKNNPDKHPWKKHTKFKSVPCENFKDFLRKNNIDFVEEFSPSDTRNFSIDIAFPTLKIGIEVNGNQHYKNNKLTEYYQQRHEHITGLGWKLYELHYSLFFNDDKMKEITFSILG